MKSLALIRFTLMISAAAALLSACGPLRQTQGDMQPPIEPAVTMPQSHDSGSGWAYHVVFRFPGFHHRGSWPSAPLLDVSGTLYGTTTEGGTYHQGTVFAISPGGKQTVLHSFGGPSDGAEPYAGLTDVNGTLYGTTSIGGTGCSPYGCGTVFSISPSGSEKVLYNFTGGSDGGYPSAALIGVDGTLYGTTSFGGDLSCKGVFSGCGTVFSITTSGSEHVLHSFSDTPDGAFPDSDLLDVNGTLYGTTEFGGDAKCQSRDYSSCGTVYSLSTSGSENVIYAFEGGSSDGIQPQGGLIDVNGTLYGTTHLGGGTTCGGPGCGVVYSVSTSGTEKVLYHFLSGSGSDGMDPVGDLLDVDGTLYGTTEYGGVACQGGLCGPGTIFSISTTGTEAVLHRFGGTKGQNPSAGLTDVSGVLYGTTTLGGTGCPRREAIGGCGTVFSFSK